MRKAIFFTVTISALFFSACKKSSEVFQTAAISDYYPLAVGKYVTYTLDSTVFINFGQAKVIRSYQVYPSLNGDFIFKNLILFSMNSIAKSVGTAIKVLSDTQGSVAVLRM